MSPTSAALCDLLIASVHAWRVPARVGAREDGTILVAGLGVDVAVTRAKPGEPFRWMVTVTHDGRPRQRPALSIVSVLRQVRLALDPGYAKLRLRIAAPAVAPPGQPS